MRKSSKFSHEVRERAVKMVRDHRAEYLRGHNAHFTVLPRRPQDKHRPWTASAAALADICALHLKRQLSAQGACKLESRILQLLPGQAHATTARAMVDIAQHADGTLRLSYCGPLWRIARMPSATRCPTVRQRTTRRSTRRWTRCAMPTATSSNAWSPN
jgi:hypothetical protein